MLARIRKAQEEEGFTLIELLVVMIIIGILAAIAIPVFLSQRAKAQDSAAKADVSTLGKEIATYWVDGVVAPAGTAASGLSVPTTGTFAGRYVLTVPASTTPFQAAVSQNLGKPSTNVVLGAQFFTSDIAWCVSVTNPKGDKAVLGYKYSAAGGLGEGVCTTSAG